MHTIVPVIMKITSVLLKKGISIYLLAGVITCLFLFLNHLGVGGFLSYLWPVLFTLVIMTITITGATRYLYKQDKVGESLLAICLAIQSISFHIAGVHFKNHFGSYLGVNFFAGPDMHVSLDYSLLTYNFANGYQANDVTVFTINFIPVLLLVLITRAEEKEKRALQKTVTN